MLTPSNVNNGKTTKHDDIHLWLSDHENIIHVIQNILNSDDVLRDLIPEDPVYRETYHNSNNEVYYIERWFDRWNDIDIDSIRIETPMYDGYKNNYLRGVCDGIVKYSISYDYKELRFHNRSDTESYEYDLGIDKIELKLLYEIKPSIIPAGSIISQIKIYRGILAEGMKKRNRLHAVVVTNDFNNKYDKLFDNENIYIHRITDEDLYG